MRAPPKTVAAQTPSQNALSATRALGPWSANPLGFVRPRAPSRASQQDHGQVRPEPLGTAPPRAVLADERLNLLIVRDTPEVVRLVEKLIASVDLPEPEVMLEVEVMELATDQVEALGLQWPDPVQLGISDASGAIPDRVFIGGRNPGRFTTHYGGR